MEPTIGTERIGKRGKHERQHMLFEIHDEQGGIVVPAMYLLINPANLSIKSSQTIARTETRGAWVEEVWGQNLDDISCSGVTAAFVTKRGLVAARLDSCTPVGGVEGKPWDYDGVPDTEAYQNMESLIAIYRNNGEAYYSDGSVIRIGSVWIVYDGGIHQGYFTNFNVNEEGSKPYAFSFDFSFKVTKTIVGVTK